MSAALKTCLMLFKQQGMNGCSPVLSTHLWYRRAASQEVLPTKLLLLIACLSTDHGFSWFRMFVDKDPLTRGVIQPTQNLQEEPLTGTLRCGCVSPVKSKLGVRRGLSWSRHRDT